MRHDGRSDVDTRDVDRRLLEVLAELESAHNYRSWLVDVVRPHLRGNILEVGAGSGSYSVELRHCGDRLVALEPSDGVSTQLRGRLASCDGIEVVNGTADVLVGRTFDSAVALNVIEHVDDDDHLLTTLWQLLEPGGSLAVWVPAFAALYGRFDREVGHFRRYRRRPLQRQLQAAGFEVELCRYYNLPGFFAWWLMIRILRQAPTSGGLGTLYDRLVIPATRWAEGRLRAPFGQSVFAVARRPLL